MSPEPWYWQLGNPSWRIVGPVIRLFSRITGIEVGWFNLLDVGTPRQRFRLIRFYRRRR